MYQENGSREFKIKAQLTCSLNISNIELMTGSTSHIRKDIQIHTCATEAKIFANKCKLVILYIE